VSDDVLSAPAVDDRELLAAARSGSSDALQELWRRHQRAAHRYATSLTRRFDADDLVSEAFLRVFSTLRNGRGPNDALRPYLFVTIRNIAIKWAKSPGSVSLGDVDEPGYDANLGGALLDTANRGKLQEAMSSLPEQWQRILWATEVQGQRPADLAPTLRLQPNSVAALAYRARVALKQAWVQVHVGDDLGSGEHRWVRERAGRYVCRALTAQQRERFRAHLDTCVPCAVLVRDAEHLAVLPIGALAVLLPLGASPPLGAGVLGGTPPTFAARLSARLRQSFDGLSRASTTTIAATAAVTAVLAVGAIAMAQDAGRSSTGTSVAAPSSLSQTAESPDSAHGASSVSAPTPSPMDPEPTPSPSARVVTPAPRAGDAIGPLTAPKGLIEPTTSPGVSVSSTPVSTTFTLSTIAAGGAGIATVEVVNEGEPFAQRADTIRGSTAVFIAPAGVTFRPQSTLVNDYQYAGSSRSVSAIGFTACVTEDDARVLRCEVVAANPTAPSDATWVWGSGDTRRIYLQVAVASDAAPGALTGSARLALMSDKSEETVFDRSWHVDVSPPTDRLAPAIGTIDPVGDDIAVQGSAPSGRLVVIWNGPHALGTATADDQGRWTITLPWGIFDTLVAQST
jgi:RNA polymerase sigma factor (sigma-70 family)